MSSVIQRKCRAYFGGRRVMGFQLFKRNLEQNVEIQHQHFVAVVGGMSITTPGVTISSWGEVDVHTSMIKTGNNKNTIR